MLLSKLFFKSPDGAFEGEIGIVPELDDRNDAGYNTLIPEGSKVEIKKLSFEESQQMLLDGIKANRTGY